MRGDELLDKLGELDADLIEGADESVKGNKQKKGRVWMKWGAAAAGVCIVAIGAVVISHFGSGFSDSGGARVQQWSRTFAASDYFRYNDTADETQRSLEDEKSDAQVPYAMSRFFSDERTALEAEQVIPVLEQHPQFDCIVNYQEDGSMYSLIFSWHRNNENDRYSSLTVTAGYQEIPRITDCIEIEVDEDGNILEPAVTVTERDGVTIVAEGRERQDKTLTFQNDTGWYQIEGSWNDSYEDMAMLLDWFWEHPIDFTRFPVEAGDDYTYPALTEHPEAFDGYIPDFAALGYQAESEILTLKNGVPVAFEGAYQKEGKPMIWWCINEEPGYYESRDSLGNREELTFDAVAKAREEEQHITFTWDGYSIQIYIGSEGTAKDLWELLEDTIL